MATGSLSDRLTTFMAAWLPNPAAQAEFVKLVDAVYCQPGRDEFTRGEVLAWIAAQQEVSLPRQETRQEPTYDVFAQPKE